ncbi:ribosomal protein S18-alanine N-acetyltransferase [Shewanella litorisediminis]|uniref:[Ribosomal protein bS18]-alanine N-acetyltransferase n=1 Tax=Shewanella litorisediminis TaxID=1173586 RepID=A0ABX7G0X5_9GAMM|nr:ribosomal protein S18-alanine N-acetyltransferase [Shewanella litorisediminis]MCL2918061.1 ribosomal protein S18-alanine N-acetyltransferase [Shewanella litorisediminis]QRH00878.1 ribosomal protein S18-alanine N-acetyltransferase [Shewanella litorisediminis]
MKIVSLSRQDAPIMALIELKAHSHPMSEGALADCFGPLYRCSGLYEDDALLGFTIVQQIVDEATLFDICVLPSAQGKGLGKLLLQQVIADAQRHSAQVLMLEVRASNRAAISLYQRLGFTEIGRRKGYYPTADGREDAVLMDLRLEHC